MIARGRKVLILRAIMVNFLFGLYSVSILGSTPVTAENVLNDAFEKNNSIDQISLSILITERINGELIKKKSDFKINFNPYKVYIRQQYPAEGLEVLYNKEILKGKALVNRNTLAFPSIKLDPDGNLMRRGSHHSLFKAGFSYMIHVLEHLAKKYPPANSPKWIYKGIVKYDNIICYKIEFDNPDFSYIDYTIKEGENLEVITKRDMISDFMIFEKNKHIDSFDDFKPGVHIKIPNDYAKHIILYIDKENSVPVGMKAYDSESLFEEYTYQSIEVSPNFSKQDFDSKNPDYGF